jgi:hypothetical protein
MRKNIIFIIMVSLLLNCCTTSMKNIEIGKIFFWLADVQTKQVTDSVIPGKIYLLLAVVRTVEGKDIYNINMNEFTFSDPNETLEIIDNGNVKYIRVRPDSFIFIKKRKCALKAEVPLHKYSEVFFWPIDWDNYTTLDFSPDAKTSADKLSKKKLFLRINNVHIRRKHGKSVDFDCAYYEISNGDGAEKYIILFERNLKFLYAFPATNKVTIKSNGRDGRDGEDGKDGDEDNQDGEDGEDGEDGGDAGSITISYYDNSDVSRFLILKANGGSGGDGGSGGKAYDDGERGEIGINGSRGRDGLIMEYRRDSFIDMFGVTGYPDFDRHLLRFYY